MGMTFKSDAEKVGAMDAVTNDTSLDQDAKLEKIAEIEAATIDAAADPEKKDEPPKPPDTQPDEEVSFKVKRSQLRGHKDIDDLLKGHAELEETLDRQGKFIKDHLEAKQADPEILQKLADTEARLKEAEGKLAAASTKAEDAGKNTQPAAGTTIDMTAYRAELKRLNDIQTQLDKELEEDESVDVDPDWKKRQREVTRGILKCNEQLADLTEQAAAEVGKTSKMREEIVQKDKEQSQKAREEQVAKEFQESKLKAFDETQFPEYKLSERAGLVWDKALQWRKDASLAVLGRMPKDLDEMDQALAKLEAKDPEAIKACNTMRVSPVPSKDIKVLIEQAQNFDYQYGYRYDKAEKKWFQLPNGQGCYPTLREATIARRIAEGTYDSLKDRSFQAGAEAAAAIAGRRDEGAVELSGREHLGAAEIPKEQAQADLQKFDVEKMITAVMQGDMKPLEEYNKVLRAAGEKEMTLDDLRKSGLQI